MDFWQTVMVLVRRWYITVPTFLATLGLAGAAYFLLPVQYQSNAILVLTTPLSGATEATEKSPGSLTNPLLNFDRGLSLSASVIIQQMNSSETFEALGVVPGGPVRFDVNNGSSNPELLEHGPFIFVQGTGPDPEAARSIVERAAAMATQVLDQRQTDLRAPLSTHIRVKEVVAAGPGRALKGSSTRAAAGAGALASFAGIAAAFAFESLMTYRRRRPMGVRVHSVESGEGPLGGRRPVDPGASGSALPDLGASRGHRADGARGRGTGAVALEDREGVPDVDGAVAGPAAEGRHRWWRAQDDVRPGHGSAAERT